MPEVVEIREARFLWWEEDTRRFAGGGGISSSVSKPSFSLSMYSITSSSKGTDGLRFVDSPDERLEEKAKTNYSQKQKRTW